MGTMTTNIIVRLQFEALHHWPDAPTYLPEAYLRHPHRHVFHVEAKKKVTHDDREIEIIALKRKMARYVKEVFTAPEGSTLYLHSMSCEMIAADLVGAFDLSYCSVLEDGENGAEVSRV